MKIAVSIDVDTRRLAASAEQLARGRAMADAAAALNADLATEQALASGRPPPAISAAPIPDTARAAALARAARRLAGRGDA